MDGGNKMTTLQQRKLNAVRGYGIYSPNLTRLGEIQYSLNPEDKSWQLVIKYFANNYELKNNLQRYLFSNTQFQTKFKEAIISDSEQMIYTDSESFLGISNSRVCHQIIDIFHNFPKLTIEALELGFSESYKGFEGDDDYILHYKQKNILFPLLRMAIKNYDLELVTYLLESREKTPLILKDDSEYDDNHPLYFALQEYYNNSAFCKSLEKNSIVDIEESTEEDNQLYFSILGSLILQIERDFIYNANFHEDEKHPQQLNTIDNAQKIFNNICEKVFLKNTDVETPNYNDILECFQTLTYRHSLDFREIDNEKKECKITIEQKSDKLYNFGIIARYLSIPFIASIGLTLFTHYIFNNDIATITVGITTFLGNILHAKSLYDNDLYFACMVEQFANDWIPCINNNTSEQQSIAI